MGDVERGSWVERSIDQSVCVVGEREVAHVYLDADTWRWECFDPDARGEAASRAEAMASAVSAALNPVAAPPAPSEQGRSDVDGDRMVRRGCPFQNLRVTAAVMLNLKRRGMARDAARGVVAKGDEFDLAMTQVVQKLVRWYAGDDPEECARDACGWIDIALRCEREGER